MKQTSPDPVIDEIRAIRSKIWQECDSDPAKLLAYFQQVEKRHAKRMAGSRSVRVPRHTKAATKSVGR